MHEINSSQCLVIDFDQDESLSQFKDTANPVKQLGGKAASLMQLKAWGMPVPDFICITAEAFENVLLANEMQAVAHWMKNPSRPLPLPAEEIRTILESCELPSALVQAVGKFCLRHPKEHFAVRSSGTLEDGADASFAGLFQTVLNVKSRSDVLCAIRTCWQAMFDERLRSYIQRRNISKALGLALVVQKLIPAEKSGVLFTVDPVRGNDTTMLVEACFGLGEALVSGQVTPDQYRYDWYNGREIDRTIAHKEAICVPLNSTPFTKIKPLDVERASEPVLAPAEVVELIRYGHKIQQRAGFPVDIEWAKHNGKLFILQSRPITQLGFAGISGEWTTADFRDGGVSAAVCTPFMASLYKSVMDTTMPRYIKQLGFTLTTPAGSWLQNFYCRPYWNLSAVKSYLSKIPGFNERTFDEGLGIIPTYSGNGVVAKTTPATIFIGLRALLAIKRSCKSSLKQCPQFSAKQKHYLAELKKTDYSAMADHTLFMFSKKFLMKEYFRNEATYFDFIYDNSNLNSLFKDSVAKLAFDMNDFPLLLSGLTGVSHIAQIEGLWMLRDKIKKCEQTLQYWQLNSATDIATEYNQGYRQHNLDDFAAYLDAYGHHAKCELDLTVPRYREDPAYVVGQIQGILHQPLADDPRSRNLKQQQRALVAQDQLVQSAPFWRRRSVRASLKQVRDFLWWREELRDLSTQFYFHVRKIVLEVEKRLQALGFLLDAGDIFYLDMDSLVELMDGNLSPIQCRNLVNKNKVYYRSFARFVIPDELGQGHSISANGDGSCQVQGSVGVAGSPGLATGIARVVTDINDADRLCEGDILITRCTDPGWTQKFSLLRGVVTETGGILSHAAVICREYGIPAILAVKKATQLIEDGTTITIDGSSGKIFIGTGADKVEIDMRLPLVASKPAQGVAA